MAATDSADWSRGIVPGTFVMAGSGARLVAVTGTAVTLRAATLSKVIMIKARLSNVGTIYIGASNVTANETAATGGFQMAPGDALVLGDDDLSDIYINGTAGDGVSYCWSA